MWGEDGACWMAWPCHALSVCFCLSWRWWWWWCSVFAAIPLAMAFACGSASCVTGSTLQWRSSAPTGDRSRRLLASSSSQLVTLDAALLRLRIAAPGHPVRRQAQGPRAMVPLEPIILAPPEIDATTFVLGSLVTGALSFGVFRTVVYFRMQLIIAHMLALHVPKGGARVVDFSVGEGRNLYYYPKDTVQVVGVNPNPKVPMLEAQAAYAKVPIRILPDVSRLPANSMDAVVSVQGMEDMSDEQVETVLRDAVRVLKPGKVHLLLAFPRTSTQIGL
uniref:Methyltransferase type 11 domain-containing protein n=1 Tax=Physcomitrium patens TaxID=3218 RepID=A0A7I4F4B3_PHYPA